MSTNSNQQGDESAQGNFNAGNEEGITHNQLDQKGITSTSTSDSSSTRDNTDIVSELTLNANEVKASEGCTCGMKASEGCTCGMKAPKDVLSIGRVSYIIPNDSLKYEIIRARVAENIPPNLSESAAINQLLTGEKKNKYRYIARHLCWILTIRNAAAYVLIPADTLDYEHLAEVLTFPYRSILDTVLSQPIVDVVTGEKGSISPPGMCGSYVLPILKMDKIDTFVIEDIKKTLDDMAKDWPLPDGVTRSAFQATVKGIFEKLFPAIETEGSEPGQRATSFLLTQSKTVYLQTAYNAGKDGILTDFFTMPPRLASSQQIVDFVIAIDRGFSREMYSIPVEVSGKFPYLMGPMQRYYSSQMSTPVV